MKKYCVELWFGDELQCIFEQDAESVRELFKHAYSDIRYNRRYPNSRSVKYSQHFIQIWCNDCFIALVCFENGIVVDVTRPSKVETAV